MKRVVFISSLILLLAFGCKKETSVEASNNIPEWLKNKIDSMSIDQSYGGTVVFRYKWHNEYVYHIDIPASSCAYCDVYNQNGVRIQFTSDAQLQDFLNNKTDQVVVWGK